MVVVHERRKQGGAQRQLWALRHCLPVRTENLQDYDPAGSL
jgi:hypothetical protein